MTGAQLETGSPMSVLPIIAELSLAAADPEAGGETAAVQPAPSPGVQIVEIDQQAAVRAAFLAAQALQGPLDGVWRLQDAKGRTLFVLALTDPGGAPAPLSAAPDHPGVEGAWRDPNRARAAGGSGFLDNVRSNGARLSLRFAEDPGQPEALSLRLGRDGRWRGELDSGGVPRPVVMTRF
jgi:hypothetical protein